MFYFFYSFKYLLYVYLLPTHFINGKLQTYNKIIFSISTEIKLLQFSYIQNKIHSSTQNLKYILKKCYFRYENDKCL